MPFEDWQQFWPWLCARHGFHKLFGILSIRDSTKARTKAALLSIGRPATRAEIGRLCGVEETRVGAHLSNVPSVVRADKDRWGLKDWIDDEYDGIVGEIIQRINEDGGATTTERLMRELPSKFNVSASSVRAYMYSRKFEIRDGLISVANVSSLQLRQLDDVIGGRDAAGAPYWTFAVEDRFFEGYSVTGVPPEFAKALGCEPEGLASVRMANFPDCRHLSLSWRLASTTGVTMGYVATPLERLGLRPGQRARVTIRGPLLVELTQEPDQVQQPSGTDVDAILVANETQAQGALAVLSNEPTLRPGLFRLPEDPVASSVLIPGFRAATRVRGAFGWFTAGWIGRLAPGLAVYLNRPDGKPIEFTVAPALFPDERSTVQRGVELTPREAAELVVDVFVNGRVEATALARHALDCLAWMLATDRLRLRIAVPTPDSNYHPKLWLFEDGVNRVLARGSGNATSRGVSDGVEHIDVDVSWLPESQSRVHDGVAMLNDWSAGTSPGIKEVVELPDALARDIIRTAPSEPPQPKDFVTVANGAESHPTVRRAFRTALADPGRTRVDHGLLCSPGRSRHLLGGRFLAGKGRDCHGDGGGKDPDGAHLRDPLPGSSWERTASRRRLGPLGAPHHAVAGGGEKVRCDSGCAEPRDQHGPGADPSLPLPSRRRYACRHRHQQPSLHAGLSVHPRGEDPGPGRNRSHHADRGRSPHSRRGVVHPKQARALRATPCFVGDARAPVRSGRHGGDLFVLRADGLRIRPGSRDWVLSRPLSLLRSCMHAHRRGAQGIRTSLETYRGCHGRGSG